MTYRMRTDLSVRRIKLICLGSLDIDYTVNDGMSNVDALRAKLPC